MGSLIGCEQCGKDLTVWTKAVPRYMQKVPSTSQRIPNSKLCLLSLEVIPDVKYDQWYRPVGITVRQHHSFVELPDDDYTPRVISKSRLLSNDFMDCCAN